MPLGRSRGVLVPASDRRLVKRITKADPEAHSCDLVAANINKLATLFPDAFTEGLIDLEALHQLLGSAVEGGEEKFALTWRGKGRARQLALTPSTGSLRPCFDESFEWNATQNLMIEGDNLEVLKLLQKSYSGSVKLIYIDPPYNTGSDVIYPDDFRDGIRNYLRITGQIDENGTRLTTNPETSGRYHTDWLNMMYPRLKLARALLREDGILMISIDDTELANLTRMCAEIFGEENKCGYFVWEKKKKPSFLDLNMGTVTDFILCFAKRRESSPPFSAGSVEEGKKYPFNNAGNGIQTLTFPARTVTFGCGNQSVPAQDMSEGNIKTELLDDLVIEAGSNAGPFRLRGEWRYSQEKLDEFVAAGAEILVSKLPFRPNYVNRSGEAKKTSNLLSYRTNGVPTNEDATEEMRKLFGADVMSHPKPSGLLKYLIRAVTGDGDLIIDFFAGSGTTAHGLWLCDAEEMTRRKFILVQLPEPTRTQDTDGEWHETAAWDAGFATIADLTKERLRRSGKQVLAESADFGGDLGFRVFRLDSSNIHEWDPDPDNIEASLLASMEHLKEDRSEQDILYELLLKRGLQLTAPIDTRELSNKTVYSVGRGDLIVCLADSIDRSEIEPIALGIASWRDELRPSAETVVIFRDSAFSDDVAKTNLAAILEQRGIATVRSL